MPTQLRTVLGYTAPYAIYLVSGVALFVGDLILFIVLSRVFGPSTLLAVIGWGGLALAYLAGTAALAWYYSRRLAPRLYPGDPARQRRTAWVGGAPLATGALLGGAAWVLGNVVDDRMLATGASPGEPHAAAIFGLLGLAAGLLASAVYAGTVLVTRRSSTMAATDVRSSAVPVAGTGGSP